MSSAVQLKLGATKLAPWPVTMVGNLFGLNPAGNPAGSKAAVLAGAGIRD